MHKEKAESLFKQGYNCAQAVLLAFCDDVGLEPVTAAKLASSFGGGMGRMREVCGAVSGMLAVIGLAGGYADPKDINAKKCHYELVQKVAAEFKEKNGSIICRELLGLGDGASKPSPSPRTSQYYKKRPCAELVGIAAEIAAKELGLDNDKRINNL